LRNRYFLALAVVILCQSATAGSDDEVTLFNGAGKAEAYIALSEEMTIYLWGGKPVAYLKEDSAGGYHVYGFNGKHLGWFVKGVVRDHQGNGACAIKEALRNTEYEPYKSYKEYKPYKSYTEYAPYRPYFSNSFGDIPCRFLLAAGAG
jgi:hypothetical protein